MEVTRRCACGREFVVPKASYHRKRCWDCLPLGNKGARVGVPCAMCGKMFDLTPGRERDLRKRGLRFFCGDPCRGQRGPTRNGGRGLRYVNEDGYMMVYVPPTDRPPHLKHKVDHLEHRVVMARIIGRHLEPEETVHHRNGDRSDNRPENLQLRGGRHGKGKAARCRTCGSHDIEHLDI